MVDVAIDDVFLVNFYGFGVRGHAEFDEVMEDGREGGGEEPGGFAGFGEVDCFFDLLFEAHGEHLVRFI